MRRPLEGIRIIELGGGISGPLAGRWLAAHGAGVIKIEEGEGDWTRRLAPKLPSGHSALFWACNAGKRSVRLEPGDECGRALREALIRSADAVTVDVTGEKDGALAGLRKLAPSAVLVGLSGRGDRDARPRTPVGDEVLQAEAGLWAYLGRWAAGEPPVLLGYHQASTWAGSAVFRAVVAGLLQRGQDGRGHEVLVSALETVRAMQRVHFAFDSDPDEPSPSIGRSAPFNPPMEGTPTADAPITFEFRVGGYIPDDVAYAAFHRTYGIDERWDGAAERAADPAGLHDAYEAAFRTHASAEILSRIRELGGKGVALNSVAMMLREPQVLARDMVTEVQPGLFSIARPVKLSGLDGDPGLPAPLLGEHTRLVEEELAALAQTDGS